MDLLAELQKGDLRTTGAADRITQIISTSQNLFDEVFTGLLSTDKGLRMRCADAIEKASKVNTKLLESHKNEILEEISKIDQQEVQWHVASIIPRLSMSESETETAFKIMQSYFDHSKSKIVRTFALQSMYDLSMLNSELIPLTDKYLLEAITHGAPSMKNRARKLKEKLM